MENTKKLVIVTGANKGIGYSIVEKLLIHPEKFQVLLTSRDIKRGQEAVATLLKKYPEHKDRLLYHELDIEFEKSIEDFAKWLKETHKSFYILVNNAAIGDSREYFEPDFILPSDEAKRTIQINTRGTLSLTEKLLPYLDSNGRIIYISSVAGLLRHHGEQVQKIFSNPKLTREDLFKLLDEYEVLAIKGEHQKQNYSKAVYNGSKLFINTYTRFALPTLLKKDQTGFAVHPGWIKTDMGGEKAPGSLEDGAVSTLAIVDLSLKDAKELSGKYFDEFGKVHEF